MHGRAGDVVYRKTSEGWAYLAIVMDFFRVRQWIGISIQA